MDIYMTDFAREGSGCELVKPRYCRTDGSKSATGCEKPCSVVKACTFKRSPIHN